MSDDAKTPEPRRESLEELVRRMPEPHRLRELARDYFRRLYSQEKPPEPPPAA